MQTVEKSLAKHYIMHPCDVPKFLVRYFNDEEEEWYVICAVIRKLLETTNVLHGQSFLSAVRYTLKYLSKYYVLKCFCSYSELRDEVIQKVRIWRLYDEITKHSYNTRRMELIEQTIM